MTGRFLINCIGPKTQSIEAVKALLSWMGCSIEPLPDHVQLDGAQLTLSSKGDVYYTTTPTSCSCPAAVYHPGVPCEHMKALQSGNSREASRAQARAYQARQRELRAKAQAAPPIPEPAEGPRRLIVPTDHVSFKPFLVDGKRIDGYVAEVA